MNHLQRERHRLYEVLDRDPGAAITEARRLAPSAELDSQAVELIRASVLVDAGGEVGTEDVIAEGVATFRRLREASPQRADLNYNLANGLSALAQATRAEGHPWFLATSALRREARRLFHEAAEATGDRSLSSGHRAPNRL